MSQSKDELAPAQEIEKLAEIFHFELEDSSEESQEVISTNIKLNAKKPTVHPAHINLSESADSFFKRRDESKQLNLNEIFIKFPEPDQMEISDNNVTGEEESGENPQPSPAKQSSESKNIVRRSQSSPNEGSISRSIGFYTPEEESFVTTSSIGNSS